MSDPDVKPTLKEAMLYGRTQERDEIVALLRFLADDAEAQHRALPWYRAAQRGYLRYRIVVLRALAAQIGRRHRQKLV